MNHDDTRPTVRFEALYVPTTHHIDLSVILPAIHITRRLNAGGIPTPALLEAAKRMKNALDQKLYGDARCAVQAMRLIINNSLGFGAHQELTDALRRIEEKLQLRANLEIIET